MATQPTKDQIERAKLISTPSGYAKHRLGMDLHPKQAAILDAMFPLVGKSRIAARCANEVGKTRRVITAAILYAIEMLNCVVVSTAGVNRQIFDQLIPSLKSYADRYPRDRWVFQDKGIKKYDEKTGQWYPAYSGFATEDEHRFQGYHRDDDRPLLIIIDEAQAPSLLKIIPAAEDRCNPDYFLICGSPGDPSGPFYDACTSKSNFYQQFKLTRMECVTSKGGWIPDEDVERIIAKYTIDNPFVKSTVFAEFSDIVEGAMISLSEYDSCLNNPPAFTLSGGNHVGLDFAAGRDKNVYARRRGNKADLVKKWQERNTMAAVGEFLALMTADKKEFGLQPEEISGDSDGLGLPMVQRIQEVGWNINEFHGGTAPRFDSDYKNAVSEAWGEGIRKIKRREIILPNDPDLKAQILGRKAKRNSSGKLELESKEDMKKRGLSSPDEADAFFMSLMPAPQAKSTPLIRIEHASRETDWSGRSQEDTEGLRTYFS